MFFGEAPVSPDLEGCILAHSCRMPERVLKKGHVLTAPDIRMLQDAGVNQVTIARLEDGDIGEDEAARRCAAVVTGIGLSAATAATGRVNIHAAEAGLLCIDAAGVPEPECASASGCCSPMCSISAGDPCPGMGQTCEPVFDPQPPGFEDVGVCTIAM